MRSGKLAATIAALLAMLLFSPPATAQDGKVERLAALVKRNVGDRIVIAGRQRMLAEGMAAKLCYKTAGVADSAAQRDLYTMWNIFGWYHAGLRNGNPQLGLSPERHPDVLNAWAQMDLIWGGLNGVYEGAIATGQSDPGTLAIAVDLTDTVTDGATQLVAALRAAYAEQLGPQGFGSALLIDLYERQRMLGQKIAKDVCMLHLEPGSPVRLENLNKVLAIFRLSLDAFQNGLADVGVPPPPSAEIAEQLGQAKASWSPAAALADASAKGRVLSLAELGTFSQAMDLFTSDMTAAINALIAATAGESRN